MDLLKFELRSFVAGAAVVGALWALAHACALEQPEDAPRAFVTTEDSRARLEAAKRELEDEEQWGDAGDGR